jgi:hypothetical protein
MKKIINEEMFEIIQYLENELKNNNEISIEVLNPNVKDDIYAGEKLKIENNKFIYRSYKSWSDLAEILFCKMLVIHLYENTVILKFQKLNKLDSFHNDLNDEKNEKYGENSTFLELIKMKNPFLFIHI